MATTYNGSTFGGTVGPPPYYGKGISHRKYRRRRGKGIWKTAKKYATIGGKHIWHGIKKTVKDNFRPQELIENLAHNTIQSLFKNSFSPPSQNTSISSSSSRQTSRIPVRKKKKSNKAFKGSGFNQTIGKLLIP